jgi:deoxyribodipyrimidine photo-lyase
LPDKLIQKPWAASPLELEAAGVSLGKTYSAPIVDHDAVRKRALAAFAKTKA